MNRFSSLIIIVFSLFASKTCMTVFEIVIQAYSAFPTSIWEVKWRCFVHIYLTLNRMSIWLNCLCIKRFKSWEKRLNFAWIYLIQNLAWRILPKLCICLLGVNFWILTSRMITIWNTQLMLAYFLMSDLRHFNWRFTI